MYLLHGRNLKVSFGLDEVSVVSNVGVNTWLGWESASLSPRGSTNDVVDTSDDGGDWSAGVTLAGVLASSGPLTSAEHTGEDGAIVCLSAVASLDIDDAGVDAIELVGVVGLGVSDVAPAANSDGETVLEPLREFS